MFTSLDSERLIVLCSRKSGGWDRTAWPQERQNLFLLRRDIEQPLSVDISVWPEAPSEDAVWQLALTVVDDPQSGELHPDWDFPVDWPAGSPSFLGYDVADSFLTSGLMNCGYANEAAELRERWARHLNLHHLFSERARALHFCRITNERIPEHAPFFVYGLYRLNPRLAVAPKL